MKSKLKIISLAEVETETKRPMYPFKKIGSKAVLNICFCSISAN